MIYRDLFTIEQRLCLGILCTQLCGPDHFVGRIVASELILTPSPSMVIVIMYQVLLIYYLNATQLSCTISYKEKKDKVFFFFVTPDIRAL